MEENGVDIKSIEEELREANEYVKTVKEPTEQKEQKKRVEEFQEIIDSERELLHLFSDDRLELEVVYGKKLLKFKIKPLEDTSDIGNIGLDFRAYMGLDDLEKEIILKKNNGETLTSSEQKVYNKKEKEFAKGANDNAFDQVHQILANFITPPSYSKTRDPLKQRAKRIMFWRRAPFDLKMFIFSEVIERLGINPETELKLFQAGRKLRR